MTSYKQYLQQYRIAKSDLTPLLLEAAIAGGRVIRNTDYKNLASIDLETEKEIVRKLRHYLPNLSIHSEETDYITDSELWVLVDPLDGSKNLMEGENVDRVSVAILLSYGNRKIAAVVYAPMLEKVYSAIVDEGVRLNGNNVHVSEQSDLINARVNVNAPRDPEGILLTESLRSMIPTNPDRGSPALDVAEVASGEVDAFFKVSYKTYDVGASSLVVEEAGGRVSDRVGNNLLFTQENSRMRNNNGIVVSNGKLHEELLTVMQTVKPF